LAKLWARVECPVFGSRCTSGHCSRTAHHRSVRKTLSRTYDARMSPLVSYLCSPNSPVDYVNWALQEPRHLRSIRAMNSMPSAVPASLLSNYSPMHFCHVLLRILLVRVVPLSSFQLFNRPRRYTKCAKTPGLF